MRRGYDLLMNEDHPMQDLSFPDIVRLGSDDRDYFLIGEYGYSAGRDVPKEDFPDLQLRSMWYQDLSIPTFDDLFMCDKIDHYGRQVRDRESMLGMGAPQVLRAMRTFTTDVELLNFRLDVQEDFQSHPELVPKLNKFYEQVREAGKTWKGAYEMDHEGRILLDEYGRRRLRDWFCLPKSFAILEAAVEGFSETLRAAATSEGLKSILDFLENVRAHPSWRHWKDIKEKFRGGAKWVVSFEFDLRDGVHHEAELGVIPPGSKLDQLLQVMPDTDGVIARAKNGEAVIKSFSGMAPREIGYVLETSLQLNYDGVPRFCSLLSESLGKQFSFYATLGRVYSLYEKLGLPVCRPELGRGKGIEIRDSIHPVVAWQAKQNEIEVVLNDFEVTDDVRGYTVSGPNDGGKSCHGKNVAFQIISGQSGMMCVGSRVRIGEPRQEVYTNFVQKDDIEKGVGRHLNELQRSRRICEVITPRDLLILDEPNGGTDNASGFEDSCNQLDYYHEIGVPIVLVSHIHEVPMEAEKGRWPGIRTMQAEIVDGELTHRIVPGRAPHSFGSRVSRQAKMTGPDLQELLKERRAKGELPPKGE